MALIDHIDGPNRDIYLSSETVGAEITPVDIYREMRELRRTDETLRQYDLFLRADGHNDKGGGKYTERYVTCLDGTRIVPYTEVSHQIFVTGVIITDDGQEGVACFDREPLAATVQVDISYTPTQVEIIEVEKSAVTDQNITDIVAALVGAEVENSYTVSDVLRIVGAVLAGTVSGAGTGTEVFKGLDGSTDRITTVVDSSGNRSSVTVDVS